MRTCIVLGSALCVWADVEAALELGEYAGVVAANDMAADWPGYLDGAASLHPDHWPKWKARREAQGFPAITGPIIETGPFPGQTESGSSGLLALKLALDSFNRAVLCGVPMMADQRNITNPRPWNGADLLRRGWLQALPHIRGRARSMSGWTETQLGRPDTRWIEGAP